MNENTTKKKKKSRRGRPPKHGGYSIVWRDEKLKEHPYLRSYIQECRDGLVRDVAGSEDNLSEQQRIMIDRIISRLSICRLIEVFVEQKGLFKGDELIGAVGKNYLAFCGQIDRALVALGLDKRQGNEILTPWELAEKVEEEDRRKKNEQDNEEN